MDIREKIGQRLVFGFPGTTIPAEFAALVREYKIGNVILFRYNIESLPQLARLCADIQELIRGATGRDAFITIDQEGGMVTRLPWDAVNVPGSMALAATGKPENAVLAAEITARQLRGVGVNFNLAPDLDVNSNPMNPVIGVRSFGDDPQSVALFGSKAVEGYKNGGMLCCGKHFPGHGDTAEDSHTALAVTYKTQEELANCELLPFGADTGLHAVMVGHIAAPNVTGSNTPATLSPQLIAMIPNAEDTLIITDSLAMDAIADAYTPGEAAVLALQAGCDVLLMPNSLPEAYAAVLDAVQNGTITQERLDQSVNKILRYKEVFAHV